MSNPALPNPNNSKAVLLLDQQGGQDANLTATIGAGNVVIVQQLQSGSVLQTAGESLLSSTALVNLNQDAATPLYTAPQTLQGAAINNVIITRIVLRNASTSLTTVSLSIGWNSTSFNSVLADATHTALTGATLYVKLDPAVGATMGTPGGVLELVCNTKQGGPASCSVDIFGYII